MDDRNDIHSEEAGRRDREVSRVLLDHVASIAERAGATAIFLPEDTLEDDAAAHLRPPSGCGVVRVGRGGEAATGHVRLPDVPLTRMSQIKLSVFLALSQGIINTGDTIVYVAGPPGKGAADTLFVTEVSHESEMFAYLPDVAQIPAGVRPEVVSRVVDMAVEIGAEGREGKPVGALFVIGDTGRVMGLTKQLVLNPFQGYPEDRRNVLDPALEETVKEFSAVDGAFIVRGDGVVESCGTFLMTTVAGETLPQGLGSRHHVASGITAATDAIAVSVSESTGTVTIFRGGKIVTEVEKPRKLGRAAPVAW